MVHKAGFVNIIGHPNVGKSTLMNALIGERLSIVTAKAQTTRHRILGMLNGEDFQIVFSDLPGIITPNYRLQEKMMGMVGTALTDADIFLFLVEAGEKDYHDETVQRILQSGIPVIVAINKIDLSEQAHVQKDMERWKTIFPDAEVMPVSALHKFNLDNLLHRIIELLPESPPYYDKDELTDKSLRFIVSEIIREKILLFYQQEIPYSVEIAIDSYKETQELVRISAIIFVMRESQKMILIGRGGAALKKTGQEARKAIERFLGKKVFLETHVKVIRDWRDSDTLLKRFGYEN